MEYDVVVGVGAARSTNRVIANSSVRTFIPGKMVQYRYRYSYYSGNPCSISDTLYWVI